MAARQSASMAETTALGVKVEALDTDIREVKDSILGLDTKIENAVSGLSREVRSAVDSLRTQFAERQRTPWVAVSGVAAVLVTIAGFIASQALSPLGVDIKAIKEVIVPRVEHDYRQAVINERFREIDQKIDQIQTRRYEELMKSHDRIDAELRELKRVK